MQQRETETKTTTTAAPSEPEKRSRAAGCGSFFVLKLASVCLLVWFGLHRADKAGVSLDVILKQPALAAASIGVMVHPDYEFVSLDKYRNTLTLRLADTGQTATLPPDQVLRGEVVEAGRSIGKALGQGGSDQGMPAWVPAFPGAKSRGVVRQDGPGLRKGVASFDAYAASAAQVSSYYGQALSSAGFTITGLEENGAITVGATEGSREAKVVATPRGAFCSIRITFTERY